MPYGVKGVRNLGSNGPALSHVLAEEYVGLEEVDNGLWNVYFGPLHLGRLDEEDLRIQDHLGRMSRKKVSPMCPDQSVTHVPGCYPLH